MSASEDPGESGALARAEHVRALGDGSQNAVASIVASLEDPDALVRGSAVVALLDEDPERVLEALETVWKTRTPHRQGPRPNPETRILEYELVTRAAMTRALPTTGDALCVAALAERDPRVRSRGVDACLRAGDPDAAWLREAVDDPSWGVRTRLAGALAALRPLDAAAREALETLSVDPHPTVRRAARAASAPNPS